MLDLEDRFTGPTLRAAAAAQILDRSLNDVSGDSARTRREVDKTERSVDRLGTTSAKSGKEIDRYSGRLAVWRDVAVTLGPALVPLGAGSITVLAGLTAELGAAAGGAGVMVLALKGVGDGLKALDKFQIDPTKENLQALRDEMGKLGPEGAGFVKFLDRLEPQLHSVQNAARSGLLPGLEGGINRTLTILPEVKRIIREISDELGGLSIEAGKALSGERFSRFFHYLDTDAAPILGSFAHALGNVTAGFADLLVDFAPLTRGFANGLEDMTARFADWAHTLDQSQSFQDFLAYLRESGPQALEFLGALSNALVGIIRAAAPLGQTVLPILTDLANILGDIAKSPIGGPLFTAAAGFIALNRALRLLGPNVTKLNEAFLDIRTSPTRAATAIERFSGAARIAAGAGGMALFVDSLHRTDQATKGLEGALGGALAGFSVGGPWGAAIGGAVGLLSGFGHATQDTSDYIQQLTASLNENTGALTHRSTVVAAQYLEDQGILQQADQLGLSYGTVTKAVLGNAEAMERVVEKQKEFADVTNPDGTVNQGLYAQRMAADALASTLHGLAGDTDSTVASQRRVLLATRRTGAAFGRHAQEIQEWRVEAKASRAVATQTAHAFITLGDDVDNAKVSLQGWIKQLEKQANALRDFTSNAKKAAKEGLDQGLIKSLEKAGPAGALRMKQLANATEDEIARANKAWRSGRQAMQEYRDFVVPPKPLTVDERQALQAIRNVERALASIRDKTVTVRVTHSGTAATGGGFGPTGFSGGGYTGPGGKYEPAGIVHRREFVFSSEATDGNEAFLSSLHRSLRGYADGGYVGQMPGRASSAAPVYRIDLGDVQMVGTLHSAQGPVDVVGTARAVARQEIASAQAYQGSGAPRRTVRSGS